MFHSVASNESSSSTQTSFTVYCYHAFLLLTQSQKIIHNLLYTKFIIFLILNYIRRSWSINKKEISMFNTVLNKLIPVILRFIKSDNMRNTEMFKDLDIIFGLVTPRLSFIVDRSHKGDKFIRKDPIQITILYLFIVFILFWIK